MHALEGGLAEWFEQKRRGRNCRVTFYKREQGIWFIVEHGEPAIREGCVCHNKHSSVFYRPEKHDLVIYQPGTGELRVDAQTRATTQSYRKLFGRHLFGNDNHFSGITKFTLEPLKDGEKSLVSSDVEGIDYVRLTEVQCQLGGAFGGCETLSGAYTMRLRS